MKFHDHVRENPTLQRSLGLSGYLEDQRKVTESRTQSQKENHEKYREIIGELWGILRSPICMTNTAQIEGLLKREVSSFLENTDANGKIRLIFQEILHKLFPDNSSQPICLEPRCHLVNAQ